MTKRLRAILLSLVAFVAAALMSVGSTPAAHAGPATDCMDPSVSGTATKLFAPTGETFLRITATGSTPATCPTFATSYRYEVRFDVPGNGDVTVASTGLEPVYSSDLGIFRSGTRITFPTTTVQVPGGTSALSKTIVTITAYATPTRGMPSEESHYYQVPAIGSYDTASQQETFGCLVYPRDWGYTKNCP